MGKRSEQPSGSVLAATTQIAVIGIAGVDYALPMALVRQIAPYRSPRPVPGSPTHIEGVINLGGRMIAVVSLRALLGVGDGWIPPDARIVVVAAGPLTAGLVADEVREILIVDAGRCIVTPAPTNGILGGSARVEGRELLLLDVPRLLGERALAA